MTILDFTTDRFQLRSQYTDAHFIEYRIFSGSNVICPFPQRVNLKLMNPLISVYICPLDEICLS